MSTLRAEVLSTDFGQDSWLSVDELEGFAALLYLDASRQLLEACCGRGGTSLFLAEHYGCQVTGVDIEKNSVASARQSASQRGLARLARFETLDANLRLPFEENHFDALLCVDSVDNLQQRASVLAEWFRVLKPGGRLLYTDPLVITGPILATEIALLSFDNGSVYLPPGENERLVAEAGFRILRREDLTGGTEILAQRWLEARQQRREELVRIEGERRQVSLQRYYETVQLLTHERRLSRFAFLAEKPLPRIPGEIPGLSHPSSRTSGLPFGRLV